MTEPIALASRALVAVRGPDWRSFLQNLLTCDVDGLEEGEARFGALLTPQGRLLYDLFVAAEGEGCLLDVGRDWREALIARLSMYRLRARVEITPDERAVSALVADGASFPADAAPLKVEDPRLPALGWRVYGARGSADEEAYDAHRLALGVPGPADWGTDRSYPIEADFDLLNGIDFRKGCFVGQETTSRMKRRGVIRTRMLPVDYEGGVIEPGTEVLNGDLRAGEIRSGRPGRSIALLRLDRIEDADLTAAGRPVKVALPDWFDAG